MAAGKESGHRPSGTTGGTTWQAARESERRPSAAWGALPWIVLATAIVAAGVGAVAAFRYPLALDVGYLLTVARDVREGAHLYSDILEVNPPLIVYLVMIPDAIAQIAGLEPRTVLRLCVAGCIGGVAAFVYLALGRERGRTRAAVVAAGVLAIGFLGPAGEFGQREHLFWILTVPYVVLAALYDPPRGPRILAGFLAGIGIALKPHFLLLPIGIEAYVAIRRRRLALRPEATAILGVHGAYGIWLLTGERGWWEIAGLAARYYRYMAPHASPGSLAFVGGLLIAAAGLAVLVASGPGRRSALGGAALISAAAGLVMLLVQGKGFAYHWIPLSLGAGLAFFAAVAEGVAHPTRTRRAVLPVPLVPLVLAATAVSVLGWRAHGVWTGSERAWAAADEAPFHLSRFRELVDTEASARSVWSIWVWPGFPLVTHGPAEWASAFSSNWLLPAVVAARRDGRADTALERRVLDIFRADLRTKRPDLLIIDQLLEHGKLDGFDFLAFALEDAALRSELAGYCRLAVIERYLVLKRDGARGGNRNSVSQVGEIAQCF